MFAFCILQLRSALRSAGRIDFDCSIKEVKDILKRADIQQAVEMFINRDYDSQRDYWTAHMCTNCEANDEDTVEVQNEILNNHYGHNLCQ